MGSGASANFGPEKTPRWTEDREAAKHKCPISRGFPSLTRVTGHASAADEGLLSADAPEPFRRSALIVPSHNFRYLPIETLSVDRRPSRPLRIANAWSVKAIPTLVGGQAIADSNFGEEIDWSRGVSLELAPQIADVGTNIVILIDLAWTPNIAQQMVVSDDLAWMLN